MKVNSAFREPGFRREGGPPLPAPALPDDLRIVLAEQTLLRLALEAVQTIGCQTAAAWQKPSSRFTLPAPRLTTVLVYSYAAGMFGSCDIAILASSDSALRYLCRSSLPDCDTIRLFRRQHVQLVKRCLEGLLETVWESMKVNKFTLATSDLASPGSWPDRRRALDCKPDFAAEAENRIKRAIHADSMAMDE